MVRHGGVSWGRVNRWLNRSGAALGVLSVRLVCPLASVGAELLFFTFCKGFLGNAEIFERPLLDFRERHRMGKFVVPDGAG